MSYRERCLDELEMIVKIVLQREGFHGRQWSDERLYSERNEGGRGLKSFKEVNNETKTKWINKQVDKGSMENEIQKE